MKKLLKRTLLLTVPLGANVCFGQTASGTIAVTAVVVKVCVVTTLPITFGNYLANAVTPTDTTAGLSLTCSNGTTYTVGLDAGTASGATTSTRAMSFTTRHLSYAIYQDSAHSQNWGNTAGTDTVAGTGTGSAQSLTAYARISLAQYVSAGAYSDVITVSVVY